ncbi:MAG: FkbM family methyltransferase [Flavobacteriaceae bacterium]
MTRNPIRDGLRRIRLARYLARNGGRFVYHGIRVSIPPEVNFAMKKQVMRGSYEEPERQLIERHLDPSLPVIELGGSLGILSAYVNRMLRPGVRYTIVEGNGALIETCRENAASTRPDGPLTVIHAACAYGGDTVTFTESQNTLGNRVDSRARDGETLVSVPARTLSSLTGEETKGGYTLIMDIEGGELDVMEQDGGAFADCRLAIVEIHPGAFRERGRSESDFLKLAARAGLQPIERLGASIAFARS